MREYEHITLAMVLLAQHRAGHTAGAADVAQELLERLLAAAQAGGRVGNVIEILVQLALASPGPRRQRTRASELLGRALALGEREGHVRVFLDAGPALECSCTTSRRTPQEGSTRAGARRRCPEPARPDERRAAHPPYQGNLWSEPLSERELDVLRLLDSDLGGPDIARELNVSVNTVRTHTRHIYAKLGVTTRREAVHEAARLGLLRRSSR